MKYNRPPFTLKNGSVPLFAPLCEQAILPLEKTENSF